MHISFKLFRKLLTCSVALFAAVPEFEDLCFQFGVELDGVVRLALIHCSRISTHVFELTLFPRPPRRLFPDV